MNFDYVLIKHLRVARHDAIVKRRNIAHGVVEKRKSEQERAAAEVQALEQLLELSTVADSKGVPQASLEERLAMLSEAVCNPY